MRKACDFFWKDWATILQNYEPNRKKAYTLTATILASKYPTFI